MKHLRYAQLKISQAPGDFCNAFCFSRFSARRSQSFRSQCSSSPLIPLRNKRTVNLIKKTKRGNDQCDPRVFVPLTLRALALIPGDQRRPVSRGGTLTSCFIPSVNDRYPAGFHAFSRYILFVRQSRRNAWRRDTRPTFSPETVLARRGEHLHLRSVRGQPSDRK